MTTPVLVKTLLHHSVADSVYKEISTKSGRYYYFLGAVLDWTNPLDPPSPEDSIVYERDTRNNIILVKEIQPSDVSYVVDRYDWVSNVVYDMYDDYYTDSVIGVDLISGGSSYSANANVTISGGGGTGATATTTVANGAITAIVISNRGTGYNTAPTVTISDAFGSGAVANAVINYAYSGVKNLQSAKYYVVTDEFNIYKCLDNNNNSQSTVKPAEISPEPFTTTDGYKWKFLGTVPISLRNKFLTNAQMPIITSINNQFYSNGEIKTINILSTGNNYSYARLTVQGDGCLEDDPVLIIQANTISTGNTTYNYANVAIEPPITPTGTWAASNAYSVGQIIQHENNYYEVIQGGTTPSYPPVHTKGSQKNGNVIFKYRGTGITANANVAGGYVLGLNDLYGMVRDVVITDNGTGYTQPPTVTITGDGSNATAVAYLLNNTIQRIEITNSGKNYTVAPNVTIGTAWVANANVTLNSQVFYGTRLYTVTTAGYANTTAPTHTVGTRTLGNASFTYAGSNATGYARLKYGSGYSRSPNITITGDGAGANIVFESEKTEAILYPYIEDGKITRVIIEDGGVGYTYATVTTVGDGTGAEFSIDFSEGDLDTLQSTSELLAVPGAIHSIQVISGGYGYTGATVSITGDGSGATATATIVGGRITKINVVSEGQGYTYAKVTISGTGGGIGATARAILPPYGGHGKDIVTELYARSLGFYTSLGQEKNQGFVVSNDYRQFGIIKNIRNQDNSGYYNSALGSGCWLISGNVNTNLFTQDTQITRASDNSKFLVISSSTSGLLAISLEGGVPAVGNTFAEPTGNTFIVTGVTAPDIDKYSGDLLYIDNRKAFTTTEDQAVSIKTVFKY